MHNSVNVNWLCIVMAIVSILLVLAIDCLSMAVSSCPPVNGMCVSVSVCVCVCG